MTGPSSERSHSGRRPAAWLFVVVGALAWIGAALVTTRGFDRLAALWIGTASVVSILSLLLSWWATREQGALRSVLGVLFFLLASVVLLSSTLPVFFLQGIWIARWVLAVLAALSLLALIAIVFQTRRARSAVAASEVAGFAAVTIVGAILTWVFASEDEPVSPAGLLCGCVLCVVFVCRTIAPDVYWSSHGRKIGTIGAAVLGVSIMLWAFAAPWANAISSLPPLELSRETTYISEPVFEDETPDYSGWVNLRLSAGVTDENNAAAILLPILSLDWDVTLLERQGLARRGDEPVWIGGVSRADELQVALAERGDPLADTPEFRGSFTRQSIASRTAPWSMDEHPLMAAWLDVNAEALSRIETASTREKYLPMIWPERVSATTLVPSFLRLRSAANALAARAYLNLGRYDRIDASNDILTLHRLGSLVGQDSQLISSLISVVIRGIGVPPLVLLASEWTEADRTKAHMVRAELVRLPSFPGFDDALDPYERLAVLGRIVYMRHLALAEGTRSWVDELEPAEMMASIGVPRAHIMRSVYTMDPRSIDWNHALREYNRYWDAHMELIDETDPGERGRLEAALKEEFSWASASPFPKLYSIYDARGDFTSMVRLSLDPTRMFLAAVSPTQVLRARVSRETEALLRLGDWSVELALSRLESNSFPADLDVGSTPEAGYSFRYYAGANAAAKPGFAITAVPVHFGESGVRGFCVDSEGNARWTSDGSEPERTGTICTGGEPLQ